MTHARSTQISLEATPYYHCINRCVRRAFLCGEDRETGVNYEHRKQWVVDKLGELANVFTIDVCAYAVMSNHYHLVLRVNEEESQVLPDDQVVERWKHLFNGHVLVSRYLQGDTSSKAENETAREIIHTWRQRLCDISWFMRCLNESIARKSNAEDHCKGRFWEGRFKSQALLDEKAVLACMVYVDLNPIRANMTESPEHSDFTSIQQRIIDLAKQMKTPKTSEAPTDTQPTSVPLLHFSPDHHKATGLPLDNSELYIQLVEWSGRTVVPRKRGAIAGHLPDILHRLGFDETQWNQAVNGFTLGFHNFIGAPDKMEQQRERMGKSWIRGSRACGRCFGELAA